MGKAPTQGRSSQQCLSHSVKTLDFPLRQQISSGWLTAAADFSHSAKEMITYKTQDLQRRHKLIALDLGYSRDKATCGIMYDGLYQPIKLTFGNAINSVSDWIDRNGSCVLVIEAVLSTFHNAAGNPDIRGDFEKGRGWYYGPGVATFAAAIRLLRVLHKQVAGNVSVYLAEAFLSFKKGRSNNSKDAMVIYNQFWDTDPEEIKDGTEPILECISGVPSVRVFREK